MLSYAASPNRSGWKIRCFVGERKTGILPVLWALLHCTKKGGHPFERRLSLRQFSIGNQNGFTITKMTTMIMITVGISLIIRK
jgi:hypothetical protein